MKKRILQIMSWLFIVYNTCCNTGYGTEAICLFQRRVGGFKADQSKKD